MTRLTDLKDWHESTSIFLKSFFLILFCQHFFSLFYLYGHPNFTSHVMCLIEAFFCYLFSFCFDKFLKFIFLNWLLTNFLIVLDLGFHRLWAFKIHPCLGCVFRSALILQMFSISSLIIFLFFKSWSLFFLIDIYFIWNYFLFFSLNWILLWFFLLNFIFFFFLLAFACFFMNIFITISFFKIKLIENYTFWLNPSKKFNGMRLLEIRLGLRGLSVLPCFFFLFSRLMFFYFF